MTKVRVVVRVRPFLPHEVQAIDGNPISCASVLDQECISCEEVVIHLKDPETRRNECYTLDSFYGQEDDIVSQIFCREVSPLIPGIFNGYNATVFAYGATGSGKTYTMQGTNELPGLMPLAMSTVLSLCPSTGSTAEISYYEVYMDKCYDLLELKAKEIMVLDDKDGQIHLRGLSRVPVSSMSEFYQVFNCGIQRRRIAHTGLNDVSSRSHRVLVIGVSSPCDGGSGVVAGKLNLIDLAGNEDNRRTCNEGIRLQESAKINQSLLALSNVIYALNNNKPRVPYRESKLTRILQDSLGGRSRALMVACLSPGEYQQSVYTVSLAARSRQVSNFVSSAKKQETPKVKVDMEALLQSWLESKGKTKSVRRFGAFSSSPFCSKTPGSVSSAKAKPTNGLASNAKEGHVSRLHRNLFNNEGLEDSWMEDTYYQEIEDSKDCFGSTKDCSCTISEECVCLTNISVAVSDENSSSHPDLAAEDNKGEQTKAAADGVVLESQTYLLDELSDEKEKTKTTESANFTGSPLTSVSIKAVQNSPRNALESQPYLLDELSDEEEKTKIMESANFTGSPLSSVSIKAARNSPRNALSPINPNVDRNYLENHLSGGQNCSIHFEPKTPKTPHENKLQTIGEYQTTPLDKFNAHSSNLKSSLVQEYLDFLNTASREELLALKGIGQKRAEYILEVRETSPLQSLSDLKKLGLSSKQVHNLFSRAARGIFG